MNKTAGLIAATAFCLGLPAGPAHADPGGVPVTFDCGSAGVFSGVANSGNSQALTWNPFFLTAEDGSRQLLVPTANDIVVAVNGAVVFAPSASKGAKAGPVTCVLSGTAGPATIAGSVTGALVAT